MMVSVSQYSMMVSVSQYSMMVSVEELPDKTADMTDK